MTNGPDWVAAGVPHERNKYKKKRDKLCQGKVVIGLVNSMLLLIMDYSSLIFCHLVLGQEMTLRINEN